jgi:hypothetical protein
MTMILVGAILAYCLRVDDLTLTIFLTVAAVLVVVAQASQDYILHRRRHGLVGMYARTRAFIWGGSANLSFKLLEYDKADEDKAQLFSKTSDWIYVILLLGSIGLLILKACGQMSQST